MEREGTKGEGSRVELGYEGTKCQFGRNENPWLDFKLNKK